MISIDKVKDPLFKTKIMGDGVAIIPADDNVYSPCTGVVSIVYKTKHAFSIENEQGIEILLHLGIDTGHLDGKYFKTYIGVGDRVQAGQKIASFQRRYIKEAGYDTTVLLIITNINNYCELRKINKKFFKEKEKIIEIK